VSLFFTPMRPCKLGVGDCNLWLELLGLPSSYEWETWENAVLRMPPPKKERLSGGRV
jgi:hypothetical protein